MALAPSSPRMAGGFLLAAADFPVLIGLKIKLLFDLAAIYGHSGDDPDQSAQRPQ